MQGLWNLIGKTGQGPGKDFLYDVGEKVTSQFDGKSPWNLHVGKKKNTGDAVSVFVCDSKVASPDEFHLAKTAQKRLKTLRHPNIIKYLDGFESETLVYVVTEPVTPLVAFLDEEDGRNDNLIAWGIHQIAAGLSFLVNDCNLIHENINLLSVFVGVDGEWKLDGVEYLHANTTDPVSKMAYLVKYDPPEGLNRSKSQAWSTDAWGLGVLIWEIYSGALERSGDLKNVKKIPKGLIIHYGDLVSANAKSRTNPKDFLEKCTRPGKILNNEFIKANLFLQEIQLKDVNEQKAFFDSLDKSIDGFPKQFCIHKVLPQLLNAFEYGSAGSTVLSPLFKVGLLLDDASYQSKIVPCIIKLFSSNDRATRIQLLQQMGKFVQHLQANVVNNQIYPCVASGFGDTVPAMREQTVKAMLFLAPKLTDKAFDQLLRHFAKLQTDEQAGIRTNTTICLGKIAPHLTEANRKKVLIPAFSRSFRDQFPPARCAGILAISATKEYYSAQDIATKLLPALCCLTIDPDDGVRENALKTVKSFLKIVEDHCNDPNGTFKNAESSTSSSSSSEAAQGASWTGWAVSSFTSRLYTSDKQASTNDKTKQQQNNSKPLSQQQQQSVNNDVDKKLSSSTQLPKATSNTVDNDDEEVSDHSDYGDAWGDDGWGDDQSFSSIKDDLVSARDEGNAFTVKVSNDDGNESGSDYGDWDQGGNAWGDGTSDAWSFDADTKPKKSAATKPVPKKSSTGRTESQSAASMLGLETNDSDFLTGAKIKQTTNDKFAVAQPPVARSIKKPEKKPEQNHGGWSDDNEWSDGWNQTSAIVEDNEKDTKEKQRKAELQKKREERKQQRELANKEKRAKSGGAMKLGAVKKVATDT